MRRSAAINPYEYEDDQLGASDIDSDSGKSLECEDELNNSDSISDSEDERVSKCILFLIDQ